MEGNDCDFDQDSYIPFLKGGVRHRLLAARPGRPVQARRHGGLPWIQWADLWSADQRADGDYWHQQT